MWPCRSVLGSFRAYLMAKRNRFRLIAAASINCDFRDRPMRRMSNALCRHQRQSPPLFRGSRKRDTIIFLHEFAADHTQLGAADAVFLARAPLHRLFRARLHPSDVPSSSDVYTYKHFYTDALAVLDHLEIDKAHFVGLSMGPILAADRPERAGARIVADTGRRRLRLGPQQSRSLPQAMPGQWEQYEKMGAAEVAKATREAPSRIPFC